MMEQLGYPTTLDQMKRRFRNIESDSSYETIVAVYDSKVVGMVGIVTGYYYEVDGIYVRIVAFVVDTKYRNKGIGKRLIEEAENWAQIKGATGIGLNSGNRLERLDAHNFYKKMGYSEKSTGFAKSLK
jgi:GNAT superfamily N-acetyltransferase